MKNQKYYDDVQLAVAKLAEAREKFTPAEDDPIKEIHPSVAQAHKHLHRACRRYRRVRVFRLFVRWGEWQAVGMGYLVYDKKSDDFLPIQGFTDKTS